MLRFLVRDACGGYFQKLEQHFFKGYRTVVALFFSLLRMPPLLHPSSVLTGGLVCEL